VALLADPNGWRRDTAQRLLVEQRFGRGEASAKLAALLNSDDVPPLGRVHALRALDGLRSLTESDVELAAESTDLAVREEGLRLAREGMGIGFPRSLTPETPRWSLCDRVAPGSVDHPDGQVRLAAILALAQSEFESSTRPLAVAAASPRLDAWSARAILSGAVGRTAPLLAAVAAAPAEGAAAERLELVEKLAATASGNPSELESLLDMLETRAAEDRAEPFDLAALVGLLPRHPLARIGLNNPSVVGKAMEQAGALARDGSAGAPLRLLGIRLLAASAAEGTAASAEARETLASLVATREPEAIQREAVRGLIATGDAATIDGVLAGIAELEPAVRAAAVGTLLDRAAALPLLLTAIESGRVPPNAVPLERRKALLESPEDSIRTRAESLFAAPAALAPDELSALTGAVRRGGDQPRGREVFARHCANCHATATPGAEPIGHVVGPALAEAADRPIERLLLDVVEPNRSVESRYEATVVVTEDGVVLEGILAANTPESVVLIRPGGERTQIPRDRIDSVRGTGRSLMPEGFGRAIPPAEFADLLAYLRQGRVIGPPP
jgi:putative heme-binding domain-containing protein